MTFWGSDDMTYLLSLNELVTYCLFFVCLLCLLWQSRRHDVSSRISFFQDKRNVTQKKVRHRSSCFVSWTGIIVESSHLLFSHGFQGYLFCLHPSLDDKGKYICSNSSLFRWWRHLSSRKLVWKRQLLPERRVTDRKDKERWKEDVSLTSLTEKSQEVRSEWYDK